MRYRQQQQQQLQQQEEATKSRRWRRASSSSVSSTAGVQQRLSSAATVPLVLLVALACTAAVAGEAVNTCSNDFLGQYEVKIMPLQAYPTPEEQRAAQFDLWTYMLFDLQSDSNFITLTWVSSLDKSVTLQCKFTCKSSAIVSHKDFQFQMQGGQMVHDTGNGAEQFNCPASPNDVNKQLLADCSADHAFDIVIKPLKEKIGTWTHNITFLGATIDNQQTQFYIPCFGTQQGYLAIGSMRKYTPWAEGFSFASLARPGSIIMLVAFGLFAAGWICLFWNVCQQGPEGDDPEISDQEKDSDSGSDSDSESGSGSDSESGSETGSDSGSEGGSAYDGGTAYTASVAGTAVTERTATTLQGGSASVAGSSVAPPTRVAAFHCGQCGAAIYDAGAEFCSNCGQRVDPPAAAAAAQ